MEFHFQFLSPKKKKKKKKEIGILENKLFFYKNEIIRVIL